MTDEEKEAAIVMGFHSWTAGEGIPDKAPILLSMGAAWVDSRRYFAGITGLRKLRLAVAYAMHLRNLQKILEDKTKAARAAGLPVPSEICLFSLSHGIACSLTFEDSILEVSNRMDQLEEAERKRN